MKSDAERLTQLEFVVAHLQANLDSLDSVVQRLALEVERMQRSLERLRNVQQAARAALDGDGSMPDERPPHY